MTRRLLANRDGTQPRLVHNLFTGITGSGRRLIHNLLADPTYDGIGIDGAPFGGAMWGLQPFGGRGQTVNVGPLQFRELSLTVNVQLAVSSSDTLTVAGGGTEYSELGRLVRVNFSVSSTDSLPGVYDEMLYPTDGSWQTKINNAGTGARIGMAAGTYNGFSVTPLDGQEFYGIGSVVLDGNGTARAFSSPSLNSAFVVIDGLEITDYAPGFQNGVIDASYAGVPSSEFKDGGWKINNCNIHHNSGAALYLAGNDVAVTYCTLADNTQLGILIKHGWNCYVGYTEIARNNEAQQYSWGGEAGGTKFWNTRNLILEHNESHHNGGPGLWSDWNNGATIYRYNNIHDNVGAPGIFHEISGGCQVYGNTITDNGFPDPSPDNIFTNRGAIQGMQPGHMEVFDNVINNCAKGIVLGHQCRTTSLPYSEFGPPWTATADVYDNTITDGRLSRAATDCGGPIQMDWHSSNTLIGNNTVSGVNYV